MERREILKLGALGIFSTFGTGCAKEQLNEVKTLQANVLNRAINKRRIIIIGAGFGGLSVAKSIRLNGDEKSEILIFDSKNIFASCPYSNLWLGGVENVKYENLLFSPSSVALKYNFQISNEKIYSIDRKNKTVSTLNGTFEYSYLVLATGIEYDYSTYGLTELDGVKCQTYFPASYKGGSEQLALKKKIENFKEGIFIITVPKGSYRCPPAPYERACMIANYFKTNNIKGKVVLIDPREKPATKAKGFLKAFNSLYKDIIEYLPMSNITNIELENKKIYIEKFDIDLKKFINTEIVFNDANIIPSNKATSLLKNSGLVATSDGWGRVKSPSFQSLNDEYIYLIGDILGEYPFPKSGQMANSCGVILGEHLAKITKGLDPEFGKNLPFNVCYSMVSKDKGIYVTHQAYIKDDDKVAIKTELYETPEVSTALATHNWYAGITTYLFE